MNIDAKARENTTKVREMLDYQSITGSFTWKKAVAPNVKVGSLAGNLHSNGYRYIRVGGRRHLAHRLAWMFVYGEWPSGELDHMNGIRSDNRIENLRLATRSQNQGNSKKPVTNTSGFKGVSWNKISKKWRAQICFNGKDTELGLFKSAEDAHAAYEAAAKQLRGDFARID